MNNKSLAIFEEAQRYIPGGVNSPVRAFSSVGVCPPVAASAHGSRLTDEDGNEYIDYICSWGPLIFGHSPDFLTEGLEDAVRRGTSYGLPTLLECEMAKLISSAYPAAEMLRMVNSGTEATMSAIRVARGFTGRDKIIKFEGCYHGHNDMLLVSSGSGALTFGSPSSLGVPKKAIEDTLVCPYNDCRAVSELFSRFGGEIACVIIEPVAGNMGLVPASVEFLRCLKRLCSENSSVLIFDEVISGFRLGLGGAAEHYGIEPDMVCFGKIIGSGLPVGAYGGRREIMNCVSPCGGVYQAGTLSGNPLAMFMGMKSLSRLRESPDIYKHLDASSAALEKGILENLKALNLPYKLVRCGSLMCLFFTEDETPSSYDGVKKCDTGKYSAYFREMFVRGILLPPSQFECMFLSSAHTTEDIEKTIEASYASLKEVG